MRMEPLRAYLVLRHILIGRYFVLSFRYLRENVRRPEGGRMLISAEVAAGISQRHVGTSACLPARAAAAHAAQ